MESEPESESNAAQCAVDVRLRLFDRLRIVPKCSVDTVATVCDSSVTYDQCADEVTESEFESDIRAVQWAVEVE